MSPFMLILCEAGNLKTALPPRPSTLLAKDYHAVHCLLGVAFRTMGQANDEYNGSKGRVQNYIEALGMDTET